MVLEFGIFASHVIWLIRTRKLRQRAKLEGVDFDDLPEARKYQDIQSDRKAQSSTDLGLIEELQAPLPANHTDDPRQHKLSLSLKKDGFNISVRDLGVGP